MIQQFSAFLKIGVHTEEEVARSFITINTILRYIIEGTASEGSERRPIANRKNSNAFDHYDQKRYCCL